MVDKLGMVDVFVDGCALGVVAQYGPDAGMPILKPWRIATSCAALRDDFRQFRCPGHEKHVPCAGRETEATGFYTDPFVHVVHKAYKRHCDLAANAAVVDGRRGDTEVDPPTLAPPPGLNVTTRQPTARGDTKDVSPVEVGVEAAAETSTLARDTVVAGACAVVGELTESWLTNCVTAMPAESISALTAAIGKHTTMRFYADADFSMVGPNQPHRPGVTTPLWNAMVTKTLHPSDPMSRCERAEAAVNEEFAALRS